MPWSCRVGDGVTRKLLNMSEETPEASEQPTDERWSELRKTVAAALQAGRTDAAEMTEFINTAANEDVRATAIATIKHVSELLEILRNLHELLGAREIVAEKQYKTEIALLDRIQGLSGDAEADALHALAAAYAHLRSFSVAPGWYTPDERHSGSVENS